MNKLFKDIIASSVEFKAKTWEQLQSAFPNASYFNNKFITSDGVYFVLASQFNNRIPLWNEDEFLGYFNLQVLKGLENLSYSMSLWLDTTIETNISDPSKRGNARSYVLSGVNETYSKANDFSDVATPIATETTIANQSQNTITHNNTDTSLDYIANIQKLYLMELTSRWNFFLKEFNWLFKKVFSYVEQDTSTPNVPSDIQAQIDEINRKINEIVAFANALNIQVQANKTDINGIKQEIITDIEPELTEQGKAIVFLGNQPVLNNTAGEIIKLGEVTQDNPLITKNAMSGGGSFTPTQANIYPTIKPMLKAGDLIQLTTNDTNAEITITASAQPATLEDVYTQDALILKAGTNITLTPDATAKTITVNAAANFTPTQQDIYPAIKPMFKAGANTTITPDDTDSIITIETNSSFTPTQANLYPEVKPMIVAGANITLTPNDTNNTISIASSGGASFTPTQANIYPAVAPMLVADTGISVVAEPATNTIKITNTQPADPNKIFSNGSVNANSTTRELFSPDGKASMVLQTNNEGIGAPSFLTINDPSGINNFNSNSIIIEDTQIPNKITITPTAMTLKDKNNGTIVATKNLTDILAPNPTPFEPTQANLYPEVKPMFLAGTNITLVPNDTNSQITINSTGGGGGFTPTQGNIYPTVKPMLKAGTGMTITPDDTGTTLTFASSGTGGDPAIKLFPGSAGWTDIYSWGISNVGALFRATPNGTTNYGIGFVNSLANGILDVSFIENNTYQHVVVNAAGVATKDPLIPITYSYTDLKTNLVAGTNMTISPNDTAKTLTLNANVSQSLLYPFLKTMLVGSNGLVVTPTDATSTITLDTSALASTVSTNTNAITKLNAVGVAAKGNVFNLQTIPATEKLATQSYADNIPNQGRTWKTVGIGSDLTVLNDGDVVKCWIIASGNNYEVEISGFFQKTVGVNLTGFKFDTNGIAWATAFGGTSGAVGLSGPAMAVRKANGGQMTLPAASVRDNKVYCLTAVNIT